MIGRESEIEKMAGHRPGVIPGLTARKVYGGVIYGRRRKRIGSPGNEEDVGWGR